MFTKSELKRLQNQSEIFKIGLGFNWIVITICLIFFLSSMLQPVNALYVNGSLTKTATNSISETIGASGGGYGTNFYIIRVNEIQYWNGVSAIIRYDNGNRPTYSTTDASASTPVNIYNGATFLSSGTVGYQRLYHPITTTEIDGFEYVVINAYTNFTSLTGDKDLTLSFNNALLNNMNIVGYKNSVYPAVNGGWSPIIFVNPNWFTIPGIYQMNANVNFINQYNATKPSGLGITGNLQKTINGVNYPSKGVIYDGITDAVLASESGYTTTDLAFNIIASQIKVSSQTIIGTVNSSILFSGIVGNGTVNIQVQDAYTGALIPNSAFQIRDSVNGVWTNQTTTTGLGTYTIGISPIVSQFATANGYQNLTQNTVTLTSGTTDYFNMQLSGVAGIVNRTNVIVYTKVSPTGGISSIPLEGVYTVVKDTVNGTTSFTDYSNSAGISNFELNTNLTYTFTSSKTGYLTTTQTLNTGTTNPYLVYQYLISKNVISPTPTLPTPYPTATPTGVPTIGAWSNVNASVCGVVSNNASIVDYLKSQMACNGFTTGLSQSLLLTGLIILICVSFGAQYGKGLGAIIGGGVGFCLSFALGIIPFMFMALLLVVLILILAIFLLAKFGK